MTESGYSGSSDDTYSEWKMNDLTLSSLFSKLHFIQDLQAREITKLVLKMKLVDLVVWNKGDDITDTPLEVFLNDAVLFDNQKRRAKKRRSQSPEKNGDAVFLTIISVGDDGEEDELRVKYTPNANYQIRRR